MADASISILIEAVNKASPQLKALSKDMQTVEKQAAALGRVAGTVAVGIGVAFAALTQRAINMADEVGKAAQEVGVSVEALSALKFAGALSDVSFDELTGSLRQLSKAFDEAEDPTSKAAAAFKIIGVSVKDAAGNLRPTEQVFSDIAESFSKAADGPEKTAIAMELFGKAGAKLIPLLNSGKEGLANFRAEAEAMGVVFDKKTTKAAEEFNDTFERIGQIISGQFIKLAADLLPVLQLVANAFLEGARKGGMLETIMRGIGQITRIVIHVLAVAGATVYAFAKGLGALAAVVGALLTGNFSGAVEIIKDYKAEVDDLDASTKKFTDSIWKENDAVDTTTKTTDVSTQTKFKNINATTEQQKAEAKLQKEFQSAVKSLQDKIDATYDLTEAQKTQQSIQSGEFAKFNEMQKQTLLMLAQELDLRNAIKASLEVLKTGLDNQNQAVATLVRNLQEAQLKLEILIMSPQAMVQQWEAVNEALKPLAVEIDNLKMKIDGLRKVGKFVEAEEMQKSLDKLTQRFGDLSPQIAQGAVNLSKLRREAEIFQRTVGDVRKKSEEWVETIELLDKWMFDGTITIKEYDAAMKAFLKIDTKTPEAQLTQLDEFIKAAAHSMQQSMSDFFFDIMQGNITDLVGSFKRAIDRIVADMLAAQVAMALFGNFGTTGKVGGYIGQFGAFLGGLAEGGPAHAGSPYVVGERGPELFVPNRSGHVIPNDVASNLSGPSSNSVNISITAMDSQDVLRALDKVKREATLMLDGTRRQYNLRTA